MGARLSVRLSLAASLALMAGTLVVVPAPPAGAAENPSATHVRVTGADGDGGYDFAKIWSSAGGGAADAQNNDMRLTQIDADAQGWARFRVTDTAGVYTDFVTEPPQAPPGFGGHEGWCVNETPNAAICTLWRPIISIVMKGFYGDDRLEANLWPESSAAEVWLKGGAGNDYMKGRSGARNRYFGDAENPDLSFTFDPGYDVVDYSWIQNPAYNVQVSLDNVDNDGVDGPDTDTVPDQCVNGLCENVMPDVDEVIGGAGNDRINAYNLSALSTDFGRPHTFVGGIGADALVGGKVNDTLIGCTKLSIHCSIKDGGDVLLGQGGTDLLADTGDLLGLGFGTNIMDGGPAADRVIGGVHRDVLGGGTGADTLDGGANGAQNQPDSIDGGIDTDNDWVSYQHHSVGVKVSLDGVANDGATNEGDNVTNIESIRGSDFADTLRGSEGTNWIAGGAGADTIYGNPGMDYLFGEGGADRIFGEAGNDTIVAQGGIDDAIDGGDGDDVILANDVAPDNTVGEVVKCGPGADQAQLDAVDVPKTCEVVTRV